MTTAIVMTGMIAAASAQTTPAPTSPPSKSKWTREHLREMRAKWRENRVKLKACRKDARAKGLDGDDRWFFIGDCMEKT